MQNLIDLTAKFVERGVAGAFTVSMFLLQHPWVFIIGLLLLCLFVALAVLCWLALWLCT